MYLRISSALIGLIALAGCGPKSPPPEGDTIACAIGEGAAFADVCTLERVAQTGDVIIHHPDGGFQRATFDPATGAPSRAGLSHVKITREGSLKEG
jgi:hypothetical protein